MFTPRVSKALLVLAVFVCGVFSLSAFADSQVRIVRLSDLDGKVQIDRGNGYEKALRNMPITQGMKLRTDNGGRAEVEFENGTTLRLAPDTAVEFPQLSLRDSGAKVSSIVLKQGTAYFNINKPKNDEFQVAFAQEQAALKDNARFRVDLTGNEAKVAVTKGDVKFQGPSGEVKVASKHTADFDLSNQDRYTVAKGVEPEQFDDWNQQESQFQKQYSYNDVGGRWPQYGLSDLNYYGNYYYVPGSGTVWQPFNTGFGWDPFMDGSWSWYPGAGYTFVSAYPWGWLPYRYGMWTFIPGFGWGWQPSGFTSWNAVPVIINPPSGYVAPTPPAIASGHPTVPVARGPHRPITGFPGRAVIGESGRLSGAMASSPRAHGAPVIASRGGRTVVAPPSVSMPSAMGGTTARGGVMPRGGAMPRAGAVPIGRSSMGGARSMGGGSHMGSFGHISSGGMGASASHASSGNASTPHK